MWGLSILLATAAVLSFSPQQVNGYRYIDASFVTNTFIMDGNPFQYISGSVHYFRVPHQYWADRLKKVRLLGFNVVSTCIEWSFHEPKRGEYNFEGDADIVKFIQLAQQEGLFVIVRVGPYIRAEREFGGFPAWLLSEDPDIKLRTFDLSYLGYIHDWFGALYQRIAPLMYGNGGPIIAVQLENEYGYYPENNQTYGNYIRDETMRHIILSALLFTSDTAWDEDVLRRGEISGVMSTVEFGPTNISMPTVFSKVRKVQSAGPLVNSEFYVGKIAHWGKPMEEMSTESVIETMTALLKDNVNFNVYTISGGTNFGFSAGSDYCSTSHYYDAPITEAGDLTDKYMAIRDLLQKNGWPVGSLEEVNRIRTSPKGAYGKVHLKTVVSLIDSPIGTKQAISKYPMNMEAYNQSYGLIAYTHVLEKDSQDPSFLDMHSRDRSTVLLDGEIIALLEYGRIDTAPLPPTAKKDSKLTILVENVGRRTVGGLYDVTRGIVSNVTIDRQIAENWEVTNYLLDSLDIETIELFAQRQSQPNAKVPAFFSSSFTVSPTVPGTTQTPYDTFLDMTGWGKGYVWVNGHNLGRYWHVGPQVTLYVPGVWLNPFPQPNAITILELQYSSPTQDVEFIVNHVFAY